MKIFLTFRDLTKKIWKIIGNYLKKNVKLSSIASHESNLLGKDREISRIIRKNEKNLLIRGKCE